MTDAHVLLAKIKAAGFSVREELGRLVVSPASRLTETQRETIKTNRDALLALLDTTALTEKMAEYRPDPARGAVQLVELALVDLDGRTVAVPAREHEELCDRIRAWNAEAEKRWKKA